MTQLIADHTPLEILTYMAEQVEICDASGKVIGHFTPTDPEGVKARNAHGGDDIDFEELKRRDSSGEGRCSTREVFEHLKSITTDKGMQDYLQQKIDSHPE